MNRRNAITTAAGVSLALVTAASAMAVNAGLLRGAPIENVGKLDALSAPGASAGAETATVPTAGPVPPQTIVITVPRPAGSASGAVPAASAGTPAVAPAADTTIQPATTVAPTVPPSSSTTTALPRTPTTTGRDDNSREHSTGPAPSTTTTTRPGVAGHDDDD